jgi:gamma-glutamyltranspeptidase/glutathione hydrolase
VALNLIDHKLSIRDAVLAPRLHWEDYVMNMEPGFLSDKASFFLDDGKIVHWPNQHMFFGGVHAVCRESDGSFAGIGDPRRSGACLQVS